ncbi:MAG TPA: hypothetical protein VF600_11150 [Abditibacteriaceae bacterium]|jgi:predicted transcriptional regulator
MTLTLNLPDELIHQLHTLAEQQHKTPEDVATALLSEKLQRSQEEEHRARVQEIGDYVQRKNAELYRRLA